MRTIKVWDLFVRVFHWLLVIAIITQMITAESAKRIFFEDLPRVVNDALVYCNLDEEAVEQALKETGGNKVKAAKLLGVGRATLYRFLQKHPSVS